MPLFHATGCHAVLVANTAAGGKLVMMHHFDPERALELIERERITTFGGVPAMVMQVLDSPELRHSATPRRSAVGLLRRGARPARPRAPHHASTSRSAQPSNGYGLTETSSVTTMNSGDDYVRQARQRGAAGTRCATCAVVPEDFGGDEPDDDRPRGPDVTGELWIKGPNVVRGYWNRPEETAADLHPGLAPHRRRRPDRRGRLRLHRRPGQGHDHPGRRERLLGRGGGGLFEHPAVADCAVIGVPHPTSSARRSGRSSCSVPAPR